MCLNLFEGHEKDGWKFEEFQESSKLSRKSGECLELHEVLIMFNCANGEWEFQNPEKNEENSAKKSYFTPKKVPLSERAFQLSHEISQQL